LVDDTNWKQYTPQLRYFQQLRWLDDDTNWKQYTPKACGNSFLAGWMMILIGNNTHHY